MLTCLSVVLQITISQLKAELEKGPQEAAVYTQQIHQLQSNLNNLQQESQVTHTPPEPNQRTIVIVKITAGTNMSATHYTGWIVEDLLLLQ